MTPDQAQIDQAPPSTPPLPLSKQINRLLNAATACAVILVVLRGTHWHYFPRIAEEFSVFHLTGFLIGAIGIMAALWAFILLGKKSYRHGTGIRTLALISVCLIASYILAIATLVWPSI